MTDRPTRFPEKQPDGSAIKPLASILLDRRATPSFKPDPVPDEYLDAILRLGLQAPSGYNIQPWRFIVVRDPETRQKLMKCAFNQAKVGEAPVVIIAFGMKEQWKQWAEEVFRDGAARRGGGDWQKYLKGAMDFLNTIPMNMWVNRHSMIAFTTIMYVAEAYGFDTAPMEGFDPAAIKREFGLPDEAEPVALLAIGRQNGPERPYPGRFELNRIVFKEHYGRPWDSA